MTCHFGHRFHLGHVIHNIESQWINFMLHWTSKLHFLSHWTSLQRTVFLLVMLKSTHVFYVHHTTHVKVTHFRLHWRGEKTKRVQNGGNFKLQTLKTSQKLEKNNFNVIQKLKYFTKEVPLFYKKKLAK